MYTDDVPGEGLGAGVDGDAVDRSKLTVTGMATAAGPVLYRKRRHRHHLDRNPPTPNTTVQRVPHAFGNGFPHRRGRAWPGCLVDREFNQATVVHQGTVTAGRVSVTDVAVNRGPPNGGLDATAGLCYAEREPGVSGASHDIAASTAGDGHLAWLGTTE